MVNSISKRNKRKHLLRMCRISREKRHFSNLDIFEDQEYIDIVKDILVHPKFRQMQVYTQHGTTSCQEHCITVSYKSYLLAKRFNLDYVTCARAGLIHDLFLYDWHDHYKRTGDFFHGMTHPRVAVTQACHYFALEEAEMDAILKHMWPLTIIPPRYTSGYVVSLLDKYCTVSEVILKKLDSIYAITAR